MNRKIPPEAFAFYWNLGPGRSYQAAAKQFGVSKKAILLCAEREGWQERLAEEDKKAREAAEKQAAHDQKARREQHLKVARFVQGKAIERIKVGDFETVMDAVKAYALMVETEREILGEPGDSTEEMLERYRREFQRWMVPVEPQPDATAQDAGEPQPAPEPAVEEPAGTEEPSTEAKTPPEDEPRADDPAAAA